MFKPYQIPAVAKAHELIAGNAKVQYVTTEGDVKDVVLRGYLSTGNELSDAEVRVTDTFTEGVFTLGFIVSLIETGSLAKARASVPSTSGLDDLIAQGLLGDHIN